MLLSQVDLMWLAGLYRLLQYKEVDTRQASLMTSFITLRAALLKTMLAISLLTPSAKRKCSYVQGRIKSAQHRQKQLKFKNVASRLIQNIFTTMS
jgi:hypothetical protein